MEDSRFLTIEELVLHPRIVNLNPGSGVSQKLTFSVKEFSNESSKSNIFVHDPKLLQSQQFSRNNWGESSSCSTIFKADPKTPLSEVMLFLKNGQVHCQSLTGIAQNYILYLIKYNYNIHITSLFYENFHIRGRRVSTDFFSYSNYPI